jgi:hypothetical protein
MKMEATRSSETPAYNEPTPPHFPENDILSSFTFVQFIKAIFVQQEQRGLISLNVSGDEYVRKLQCPLWNHLRIWGMAGETQENLY